MSKHSLKQSRLLATYAAQHRQHLTWSERLLWQQIRSGRLGVVFRRQVPVLAPGVGFIADFLAPSRRLIVEVDGAAWHRGRKAADARRDRKLARLGYRVLRLDAGLVERDVEEAVRRVREALR